MSAPKVDIGRLRGLLEQLEAHWRRVDAPILRFLQPGLDEAAMDAQTSALGLQLPVEARVWYGWHDGTRHPEPHEQPTGRISMSAIGYRPLPLDKAVGQYLSLRRLDCEAAEGDPAVFWPDDVWPQSWFPIAATLGEDLLAISCDVPEGAPTPVRHWDTEGRGLDIAARSLTEVVGLWVWMLDEGLMYWSDGKWLPDASRYDPDIWRRAAAM